MFKTYCRWLQFEIMLISRQTFAWVTPIIFFTLIISFFPLALGPDQNLLHLIAPGIIWIAALLSILLSINHIFRFDADEGMLELFILSPYPLYLLVMGKVFAYWFLYCLPLIVIAPMLGLMLHMSLPEVLTLMISLLIGTPAICLIGAIGSALVLAIRGQSLLLPIIILPMYIPILIFGSNSVTATIHHAPLSAYFAILGAFSLLSFAFAPLLTAEALKLGVGES
jgi:heme exporter protein B